MTKAAHVHRLKRLKYKSGNTIFFCALPDCSFKTNISLALGKRSICWRCGEPFIMSDYSLRLAKPHCDACHKPKGVSSEEFQDTLITDGIKNLTLAQRLEQTIYQAKQTTPEMENEEEI